MKLARCAVLVGLLALSGCFKTLENASKTAEDAMAIAEKARGWVEAAGPMIDDLKGKVATIKAAAKNADTDGDGKTDYGEWAVVIAGLLSGGLLAKSKLDKANAEVRNAKSDGRKDGMEARLASVEATLTK